MDVKQFKDLIIRPTLKYLDPEIPYSSVAEQLVLETIYHESDHLNFIAQINGPARGIAQIEEPTFNWLITVLHRKPALYLKFSNIPTAFIFDEVTWNLRLSVAFCRFRYFVLPAQLPNDTLDERAAYWFKYYNASGVTSRLEKFKKDARNCQNIT